MIRKLRWKFVAVCMGLVALVLSAVFGAAYHAVRQNIEDLSRQMLYQVLREDSGRGAVPNPTIEIGGDRVLLPYFTVNIWGDTAYITGGTYADLENTDTLRDILSQCLEQEAAEGTVNEYHLRYLSMDNGLYRKLAFVDMSMEQAVLRREAQRLADLVRERVREVRALSLTPAHHTYLRDDGDGWNGLLLQQRHSARSHVLREGDDASRMGQDAPHGIQLARVMHVHVDVRAAHHHHVRQAGPQREGARADGVDAEEAEEGAVVVVVRDVVHDGGQIGVGEVVRGVHHLHAVAQRQQVAGDSVARDGVPRALLQRQHQNHALCWRG